MTEDRRRILDMLAEGKISAEEAERLLSLIDQPTGGERGATGTASARRPAPKYLRVLVEPDSGAEPGSEEGQERVNIRVPVALIRAGMKFSALMPSGAAEGINKALRQKGIDLDVRSLKTDALAEQLIDALRDLEVDVQDGKQKVRVYVE